MADRKPKTERATAQQVRDALRKRFDPPGYALFEEVGNSTGSRCDRHADAVCVSLWPSRGLLIHGIEIKVSRSDWTNELKDPAKADAIQRYCDHWWLAVGDDTIVQPGELPETWGLLVLRGGKLICTKEAPKLEPQALDRGFVAAILRRAHEAQQRIRSDGYNAGREVGASSRPEDQQRELDARDRSIDALKAAIGDFEQKSGLKLDRWNAGRVGDAVHRMMELSGGYRRAPRDLTETLARQAEEFARLVRLAAETEEREAKVAAETPQLTPIAEAV